MTVKALVTTVNNKPAHVYDIRDTKRAFCLVHKCCHWWHLKNSAAFIGRYQAAPLAVEPKAHTEAKIIA